MPSLVPLVASLVIGPPTLVKEVERAFQRVGVEDTVYVTYGPRLRGKALGKVELTLPQTVEPFSMEATAYNLALHEAAHRRFGKDLFQLMPEGYASGYVGLYGKAMAHPLVATREDVLTHWREWPIEDVLAIYVGTIFWSYSFILSQPPSAFSPPIYPVVAEGARPYKVGGLLYILASLSHLPLEEWRERATRLIYLNLRSPPELEGPWEELHQLLRKIDPKTFLEGGEEALEAVELLFSLTPRPRPQ